jgi:hypothetical protein
VRGLSFVVVASLAIVMSVSLSSAQSPEVNLAWFTIDGGGAVSSDGTRFALSGSIGQPDTGDMSSDAYTLTGGFWPVSIGPAPPTTSVYLPLLQK